MDLLFPTDLKLRREVVNGRECLTIITETARFSITIERVPDLIAALREFVDPPTRHLG
jgi:hypothetical protein